MLFLQAKAQNLVNKAVEADEKVATIKATDKDDVDGSMGWFQKMLLYSAQGESNGQIDAQKLIEQHNKEAKEAAVKSAEEERDAYRKKLPSYRKKPLKSEKTPVSVVMWNPKSRKTIRMRKRNSRKRLMKNYWPPP